MFIHLIKIFDLKFNICAFMVLKTPRMTHEEDMKKT